MLGKVLSVMGLASAACLFVAGCKAPSCPDNCATATFAVRALDDSTVTWSFAGGPSQTTTGFVSDYPPTGTDCSFAFSHGEIQRNPLGDAGADSLFQGTFDVHCGGGADGGFDFVFGQLADYRDWSVGTFTMVAPLGNFAMDFFGPFPANGCRGASVDVQGLVMTVTVETATGSRAPYPQLVTGDFVRTFHLAFDTSTATATTSGGVACDFPLVGQVSLHLTQTAADYVYKTNAACYCD